MKKIFILFISCIFVLCIMHTKDFTTPLYAINQNTTEFMGGEGTINNPYLISNRTHLNNVRKYMNAHFKLVCDIVFDDADFDIRGDFYNNGLGFEPIGNSSSPFRGTFDGNNHVIKNLHISNVISNGPGYVGLFGYNSGTIKNLGIIDGEIKISNVKHIMYVGSIAGYNYGTIMNCYNTSKVLANHYYSSIIGGIVGQNESTITNCYNLGLVQGDSGGKYVNSGGIAGINKHTISKCYNAGTVISISHDFESVSGGIAAKNSNIIVDCYNTGSIYSLFNTEYADEEESYSGGIVGHNTKEINNCYNIGTVWGYNDSISVSGGIVGFNEKMTKNCYYADFILNGTGSGTDSTIKCTIDELMKKETFNQFDFDNTWEFDGNSSLYKFPVLKNVKHIENNVKENTSEFAGGHGTYYSPYLIENELQFNNVRNYLDSHFKLINDIDLSDKSFEPIANTVMYPFKGTFNGNGHSIKNINANVSENTVFGIFGFNNGKIFNLDVQNGSMLATTKYTKYIGGIVGYNYGILSNCSYAGEVKGQSTTGGLVGYNAGLIIDSYNEAYILSESSDYHTSAGGVSGFNKGEISSSYNLGLITSIALDDSAYAGGIAGCNAQNGQILKCYNSGAYISATGDSYAASGGVVGYNLSPVLNCYNVGEVYAKSIASKSKSLSGGIAGYNYSLVEYCYNIAATTRHGINTLSFEDGQTIFENDYCGGIVGANDGTVTKSYYLGSFGTSKGVGSGVDNTTKCSLDELKKQSTFAGFDFENNWVFNSQSNSYFLPTLKNIVHKEKGDHINFSGGIGTAYNPYLISNATQLDNARNRLGSCFKLTRDIDLGGKELLSFGLESPFDEILSKPFYGIFDGNGYAIKNFNMNISTESSKHEGLFVINKGTIKNLGISNGNVKFEFLNSSESYDTYAGALVGDNRGVIDNCYNDGVNVTMTTVTTVGHLGGLIGDNSGTITKCHNSNNEIIAEDKDSIAFSGGISGSNTGDIANCFNNSILVDSSYYTGGIVGRNYGSITNCYNVSTLDGIRRGGIVGYNTGKASVTNCYYLYSSYNSKGIGSNYSTGNNGTYKCSADALCLQSTFTGFDFDNIWGVDDNLDYKYPQFITGFHSISLVSQPEDNVYIQGNQPNLNGAYIKVLYELGNKPVEKIIPVQLDMLKGFDDQILGNQEVSIVYKGLVSSESLVLEGVPRCVTSIKVTKLPTKLNYVIGQYMGFYGIEVTAYYNDNTSEIIKSNLKYSYKSQIGTVPVTVTYKDFSDVFYVTMKERIIKSITFTEPTNVVNYLGEELNLDGGYVRVVYESEDDYAERILLSKSMISGYDKNTLGYQNVTITYLGYSRTFMVNVIERELQSIEIETLPNQLIYLEGDKQLNTEGLQINLCYENGYKKLITSGYSVSGFDSTPGTKTIVVTYRGQTVTFTVEVKEKSVVSIEVISLPNKVVYLRYTDNLELDGGKILVSYNNNTSQIIDLSNAIITGFDNQILSEQTLIVSYRDVTTTFNVNVIAPIESVEFNKTELTLEKGNSETLIATINPSDTTDETTLTWTSSDENVVIVDENGKVNSIVPGSAIITATTINGKEAQCIVTVLSSITSVELNKTELTLEKGNSETLIATINPSDTTDDTTLTWTSSDENIVTVDQDGKVTAVGGGTATITVTTSNGKTATCNVTVLSPIVSIELNKSELTLNRGDYETLIATINPSDTTDDTTLTWTSSDENIVSVDQDGNITAFSVGTATITVTTSNRKTATCNVTVLSPIVSIELNKSELTLNRGDYETLIATINPSDTTDDTTLTWTSSDENIVSVEQDGNITAVGGGTATITVTTSNGKTATCNVTVLSPIVSIELNKSELTLNRGDYETLIATINPSDTTDDTTLTWTSSDENIVSVEQDGKVTAVSSGTATITVTTSNSLTATCTVTVKAANTFPFTDVKSSKWYYSIVKEAYEAGLMSGTSETTFSPDDNMTRGMIVTVLHRIAGKPDATPQSRFPDVGNKSYCAVAVEWAAKNKVVSGYSNGKFGPNDNITRQDVAVILYNYARSLGLDVTNDTDLSKFKDYKNVSAYAKPAMEWAVSVGILGGATDKDTGDIYLNPKNNATRAECAKMLLVASKIYK